jgi:hypothetical protein
VLATADVDKDVTSPDDNLKKIKSISKILKAKFLILFFNEGAYSGKSFALEVNTVLIGGK